MKFNIYIILSTLWLITACENINETTNTPKKKDTIIIVQKNASEKFNFETLINSKAKIIAGITTKNFSEIQGKDFYKNHTKSTQKNWESFHTKKILPLKNWIAQNQTLNDTTNSKTIFYPFSGPDILYALNIFPNAENYILIGLENIGTIPEFTNQPDSILEPYFQNLSQSLRNLNKYGYFVTQNMKYDFRKNLLDGVLHIILYHLSLSEYDVLGTQFFEINPYGNQIYIENTSQLNKNIEGIKIWFKHKDSTEVKTLSYIQADISDRYLSENKSFIYYLSKFEEKTTFIKSASYLLFNAEFSLLKNLILEQSNLIVQDDTGLPYSTFAENNFNTKIYGTYNKTIKIYKEKYQPNLQKALKSQTHNTKLPFRFGYNNRFNETVLILANKNKAQTPENELVFKVQLTMLWEKVELTDSIFAELPTEKIDYYFDEGYYKYTLGLEYSEEACESLLELAHNAGFTDAFIAGFRNGNRIILDDLKK